MLMVRWMYECVVLVELRGRLGLEDDIILVVHVQKNRLHWYEHVLRKEEMIGLRNAWSMNWRVPDQEV